MLSEILTKIFSYCDLETLFGIRECSKCFYFLSFMWFRDVYCDSVLVKYNTLDSLKLYLDRHMKSQHENKWNIKISFLNDEPILDFDTMITLKFRLNSIMKQFKIDSKMITNT